VESRHSRELGDMTSEATPDTSDLDSIDTLPADFIDFVGIRAPQEGGGDAM